MKPHLSGMESIAIFEYRMTGGIYMILTYIKVHHISVIYIYIYIVCIYIYMHTFAPCWFMYVDGPCNANVRATSFAGTSMKLSNFITKQNYQLIP